MPRAAPDRSQDASPPPCSASFAPGLLNINSELCLFVCLISFHGSCGIYIKKIFFIFLSPDCLKVIFLGFSREAREAHGGPCDSSAAELVDTPLPSKVGRETPAFICL